MRLELLFPSEVDEAGAFVSPYTYRHVLGDVVCPSCDHHLASINCIRYVRVCIGYDTSGVTPTKKMANRPVYVCRGCAEDIDDEDLDEELAVAKREAEVRLDERALELRMEQNLGVVVAPPTKEKP